MIYFLYHEPTHSIKIGYAKTSIMGRVKALSLPGGARVVHAVHGDITAEQRLHCFFLPCRMETKPLGGLPYCVVSREWFEADPVAHEFGINLTLPWDGEVTLDRIPVGPGWPTECADAAELARAAK